MVSYTGRYGIALLFAVVMTFLLLWGMQALIVGGNKAMTEAPRGHVLDFIRLKKDEQVLKKERKPQKPAKPKEPPPPPMVVPQMQQNNPNSETLSTSFAADIQIDAGLSGGLSLDSGDGDYLPIVKVAPIYPRRAQARGIAGYVIVEFTVTKNGSVKDPVVVEANPESLFDRAAMDAVLKFKYKPRVVDGEAMAVAGVQNKITFQIDD
ncbi:energy transducer TonB [Colwellia sp. MB02u-18]|uniref:energy transducer TonB n=1 Tax=unclassified Colwellia TaxID=196834 RepID=UPI0015F5C47B|nr:MULTISPECIES: energy transducer TonB [unclassified Colwellia]MBA6223822.1 energy transducer TonB [Colwellia sp. MB3u-45]MBA6267471.1 energy transducer TonB [Colwellia sp. MB3u-43]MBA6320003.1 energy transducer TonB [Colwellia sp. MB02u-19]MBA6324927.1 energy transducer TonB [Colwellia sp. MB02u-18]MBA6330608.1 energy transducer TonB [Colwellia sp. MB02u-12]